MEALRSWIAPFLIRALDEHPEVAESKSWKVEEDLSNLYIHCDGVEIVQFVEVRASSNAVTFLRLFQSRSCLRRSRLRRHPWTAPHSVV